MGGILNTAGVNKDNLNSYYQYVNRLVQADWAKDGHYFLPGVKSQADADALLAETRQAIDAQYGNWVNPTTKAAIPMWQAWENAAGEVTQQIWNPMLKDLEAVGRLKKGTADQIIATRGSTTPWWTISRRRTPRSRT
jgi:hypothetical protein